MRVDVECLAGNINFLTSRNFSNSLPISVTLYFNRIQVTYTSIEKINDAESF